MKLTYSKILYRVVCSLVFMLCTATAQQTCLTAQGSYGQCVPVKQCQYVLDILARYNNVFTNVPPQVISDLQKFQCQISTQGQTVPVPGFCCETMSIRSEKQSRALVNVNDYDSYKASLNGIGVNVLRSLQCGLESSYRVKNGQVTALAEFPFMALLRYDTPDKPFQCSGSLITTQYVLSAAHCIENKNVIGIRLGEHDISTEFDCRTVTRTRTTVCLDPVEDLGIDKISIHPDYNGRTVVNDVALIKMDRSVDFKPHIKPICLPITKASFSPPEAYLIAGWGATETGTNSNVLLKATVDHQDINVCKNLFRRATIDERHVCAGNRNKIVDSCRGDSGGPLFFPALYENTPRYVQYGIVSFGVAQCDSNETYPGVYSNVLQFMPWITSNIN